MSSEEVGANTWEAASQGEQAEALSDAMAVLEATFDALMDDLKDKADWLEYGYTKFKTNLDRGIGTVQAVGMQLANTTQEGASGIAHTDHEAGDDFQGAWGQIPKVNFCPRHALPPPSRVPAKSGCRSLRGRASSRIM